MGGTLCKLCNFFANNLPKRSKLKQLTNYKVCRLFFCIYLKKEISTKDRIISKLRTEKEILKEQLQKFKGFWHSIIKHFQSRLGFDKNEHYKYVTDDLYKNGVFNDNEKEIATTYSIKIKTQDEINTSKTKKKNNMELK